MINGWTITTRCANTHAQYYVAKKGNRVHTGKSLSYVRKCCTASVSVADAIRAIGK